jgi:zinc transport system permease protein
MNLWHCLIDILPFQWAHYAFMQNALLAILLVTPLFALLGCLVINNQMAFFSDAIGHASLTGIAIGVLLGLTDPTWSMLGFALFLAVAVSVLRRYSAASTDTLIGLVMAFAMALGIVLLSRGGGFAKYSRFLIGDILTITPREIARLAVALVVVVAIWCRAFNQFMITFLNRSLARSRGIHVWAVETGFAAIVAAIVAISIPWVGLLVINSLLIIPAAAARNVARTTAQYVNLAIVFSCTTGILGLVASFYWGTATGGTIVLVAMALYVVSLFFRR